MRWVVQNGIYVIARNTVVTAQKPTRIEVGPGYPLPEPERGGTVQHTWMLSIGLAGAIWSSAPKNAHADSNCAFFEQRKTLYLRGDCETDVTLTVPDGFTLDGQGHRVTARNPVAEAFKGAVVRNAGNTAHIRNLIIYAQGLGVECHPSEPVDLRLRGILLQDASGTVVDNQILAINQGSSGCQEGAAIEVRTTSASSVERTVTVRGNRIYEFQKTGILVLGNVDADVALNRIRGRGPIDFIAQNGIQISDGARGDIRWNHVSDVIYTGPEAASGGILVLRTSEPIDIAFNHVESADVGLWLSSASRVTIAGNVISSSTYDGIALDGQSGATERNRVLTNRVMDSGNVGIDLYGLGAVENFIGASIVCDSEEADIQEVLGATNNVILGVACSE